MVNPAYYEFGLDFCRIDQAALLYYPKTTLPLAFAKISVPNYLPCFTKNTITDKLQLQEHLQQVRKQRFAVDDEEIELGVRCIATPVFNHTNQCIASIGISGPSIRIKEDNISDMAHIVINTGIQLSHILGQEE